MYLLRVRGLREGPLPLMPDAGVEDVESSLLRRLFEVGTEDDGTVAGAGAWRFGHCDDQ